MLPDSSTPKTQYWSLNQNTEGLLDLNLNLSGLPAEDVASQLRALLEMVARRCESDREIQGIGSSEESDLDQESDRIGSRNRIESDRIGSDEVFLTCPEIAAAVGVSAQAVHKRSKDWIGGRKRPKGKGLEYPVSALPKDWQLQVFDYVSIGD